VDIGINRAIGLRHREQDRFSTRRNEVITQSRICIIALNMALLIALMAAPVTGQSVKTKSNPNRDISKLSKYAWKQNKIAAAQKPEVVAEMDRTIKDAVNRELAQKGYIENPQNPDKEVQNVVQKALKDLPKHK